MSGLAHLRPNNENTNIMNAQLNAQMAAESLAKLRAEHGQTPAKDYDHETRSIHSGMTYN